MCPLLYVGFHYPSRVDTAQSNHPGGEALNPGLLIAWRFGGLVCSKLTRHYLNSFYYLVQIKFLQRLIDFCVPFGRCAPERMKIINWGCFTLLYQHIPATHVPRALGYRGWLQMQMPRAEQVKFYVLFGNGKLTGNKGTMTIPSSTRGTLGQVTTWMLRLLL